jgi:hypothetical protein
MLLDQVQNGTGLILPGKTTHLVRERTIVLINRRDALGPPDDLPHVTFLGQPMQKLQLLQGRRDQLFAAGQVT